MGGQKDDGSRRDGAKAECNKGSDSNEGGVMHDMGAMLLIDGRTWRQ